MDILIIGAGMAAYTAASVLLKADDISVTIISGENYAPYYRTRILETLAGAEASSLMADTSAFPMDRYRLVAGVSALQIDRKAKSVGLSDGSSLEYDVLILAMGSHANLLSLENSDAEGIIAVRSLDDALSLKAMLSDAAHPAVIGGGVLGLEAAYLMHKASGLPVTVLEGFSYLLPRQLDEDSSAFLKGLLEEKGLVFETGVKISGFEEDNGHVSGIRLEGGRTVNADLVAESVGVTPNISLAATAGLSVNRGILVDEYLRTNDRDIYAIGDVAEFEGKVPGLMSTALDMGRTVGAVITGKDEVYRPASPSVMLKVAGLDVFSFGYISAEGTEKFIRSDESSYECCFVKDGILTAAVSIGTREHVALFRGGIGKPFDSAFREKAGL